MIRSIFAGGKEGTRTGVLSGVALLGFWTMFSTIGYMIIEKWNFIDSLYMALLTLSTVGFSEVQPMSNAGKLFTSFVIVVGLATTIYTFTRLGQLVFEGEILDIFERKSMKKEIAQLNNHFIVCGYGRVGRNVVDGLKHKNQTFCVIDQNPDLENELREAGVLFLIGDVNAEDVLKEARIENASQLLGLLPSDADNLYLSMLAKELNPDLLVIARSTDPHSHDRLKRGGADKVISHYQIASQRILHAALHPTFAEFIELWNDKDKLEVEMDEIEVPESSNLDGVQLSESRIREMHGGIVIAVKEKGGKHTFNPAPDYRIQAGDILIILGRFDDLRKLEESLA